MRAMEIRNELSTQRMAWKEHFIGEVKDFENPRLS